MLTPAGLTALETASGAAIGAQHGGTPPPTGASASPMTVLMDAMRAPLSSGPCVVSFSGGRDSSLVLAAAVAAARRDGLALPVAVTLRFPGDPRSAESHWQERLIAHVGVEDWQRVELPGGLDFVGDVAGPLMLRHGPLYPPNAHLIAPMLPHAAGGTVLGGLGGDELFGLWNRRRLADVAARREPPAWTDVARVAGALAPAPVRRAVLRRRRLADRLPWLRPAAQAALEALYVEGHVRAPNRWDRHVDAVAHVRSLRFSMRDIDRVAATGGARYRAPLLDPGFTASLAAAGGWRGFGGRGATLRTLFGELLPDDVITRRDKATFNDVFFTEETRRFAQSWSGSGIDESVVDPEALRRRWRAPFVDYRSAMLLQSAWLHDRRAQPC